LKNEELIFAIISVKENGFKPWELAFGSSKGIKAISYINYAATASNLLLNGPSKESFSCCITA
jgi:hypothetical protein